MKSFLLVAILAAPAAAPRTAAAQPVERPMLASAHAMLVLPQADADDYIETSLGARVAFGYSIRPWVAILGSVEYVLVNEASDTVPDDTSIHYWAIDLGARFTLPRPRVQPFGELLLGRHTAGYDSPTTDDSDSELGIRLGAGLQAPLTPDLRLIAQLAYTSAEIENADLEAITLEAGAAWSF